MRNVSHPQRADNMNIKYYIPLCDRPVIPVTINMIDRVTALESDNETVKKCKSRLQMELAEYLGCEILRDSPHLYRGQIVRAVVYGGVLCAVVVPFDLVAGLLCLPLYIALYGGYSCYLLDIASIHKKYKILIEQEREDKL